MLTRGIKNCVDRYISDLQAQYFEYGGKGNYVQLAVRPIQLWEVAFPKESFKEVCGTLHNSTENRKDIGLPMAALRKVLGAKKLPKLDFTKIPRRLIYKEFVATYPIGYREDAIWKDGPLKGKEQL